MTSAVSDIAAARKKRAQRRVAELRAGPSLAERLQALGAGKGWKITKITLPPLPWSR